ncbi:hypothetical protein D9611_012360 [Ephemerocybe angulata]|uniref:Uncharacterized protein n=1 Tax=Ephemerocybe angulata TaxID=980116 RepID=A0A8H5CEL1_9AGAR|nr:hypothetical protein D9611_012360 [Tulosesus angulatus]
MEPSQEATTSSKPPGSPQSKIPRRTSSRTQQHPSRKSSVSASASTPHSLNAPAPWLMRRTSHSSLRGGKSASTTSLSVPGVGTGAGVGPGGGGSGGNGVGGAAAPVASVTVVFAEGTGAPPSLSAEESVGTLAGFTASPSSSSSSASASAFSSSLDRHRYLYRQRARDRQPSARPSSPSLSTSPSKTASWFASRGRSKTRRASSASNTTRPGISLRVLGKGPATHEEEGETDGLLPMMRIMDLFPEYGRYGSTCECKWGCNWRYERWYRRDAGAYISRPAGTRCDDPGSAIGLSDSPNFTSAFLPLAEG